MAATTTQTQIANRALQILGYQRISSITENSRGAIAINRAYQPVLLKTLRDNYWSFAIMRAILPAAVQKPAFGPAAYFPLPGDFLHLAPPDDLSPNIRAFVPGVNGPSFGRAPDDWQIENMGTGQLAIASNEQGPIYVRYVSSNVTESMFDVSFAEALSANLAFETCEELTQSNSKLAAAEKSYDDAIKQARKRNAFEMQPMSAPMDDYLIRRL